MPVEEALDGMYDLMAELYPETRTSSRAISSIETVTGSDLFGAATRSSEVPADNLVYVVNFANEGGFAVLGANRAVDEVICITENGSFDVDLMESIVSQIALQGSSDGSDTSDVSEVQPLNPGDGMMWAPTAEWLIAHHIFPWRGVGDDDGIPLPGIPLDKDGRPIMPQGEGGEGEPIPYDVWYKVPTNSFEPMLETKWDQRSPFNDQCPNKYPAGCVAIALAQIVAHNEHPLPSNIHGDVTSTWDEMKSYGFPAYRALDSITRSRIKNDLALIIQRIGKIVDMDYGKDGSSAGNPDAKDFLQRYYNRVDKVNYYDKEYIMNMLIRKRPVYIGNFDHAWVIDGSLHQQRLRYIYTHGMKSTTIDHRTLVHCNFGWGGASDGYYIDKAFHAYKGPVEIEAGVDGTDIAKLKDGNYTSYFRIITYGSRK